MDKEYIVSKANKLIAANYNLSLAEQKIILTLASMVQPSDKVFKPYKLRIKDFVKLLDIKDKKKYSEIPKITKGLMKKVFEINEGNRVIQIAWLSSVVYEKGSGMVELEFSPKLKPYMLQLRKLYTSYKLENILQLKSKYSIRIYEILKSHQFKKQECVLIELEELRKMLGLNEKQYPRFSNFNQKVLSVAQKEVNENTDIYFKFKGKKQGRKVKFIEFCIKINELIVDEKFKPYIYKYIMVKNIIKEKITDLEAKKIFDAAGGNYEIIKEKYNLINKNSNIDNLVGWLIKSIKDDYKNIKKDKKSSFTDYDQRDYDFDELEKKLLDW